MFNSKGISAFLEGFVVGGMVGAALALLLAPQSGEQTRAQIRTKGFEVKDRTQDRVLGVSHRVQGQAQVWQRKGKEAFKKGTHTATEAFSHGKDSFAEVVAHRKKNMAQVTSQYEDDGGEEIPG